MKNSQQITDNAKILWNYMHMNQKLKKADLILVLGSHDIRVAETGAKLFLEGYAPKIMFSGGLGKLTGLTETLSEAERFTEIAIKSGVPKDKIILENKSTNSIENITFSYNILKEINEIPRSIILVQKPYMERRAYATFKKHWLDIETEVIAASSEISFDDYIGEDKDYFDTTVNLLVGDIHRMIEFPKRGLQIDQDVPDEVLKAFEMLKNEGYTKNLLTY